MWFTVPLSVVALVAALGALRTAHVRRLEARTQRDRKFGPDGIVIGAESVELSHPHAPAVLLLHGAGDTPQTLRYVADALHARGFHVAAPLLPGHGRTLKDFANVTADGLAAAVMREYSRLRMSHEWVGVIGLSMGGALAVDLAAQRPDVGALGLVAPYLAMPRRIEMAARASVVWGTIFPVVESTEGLSVLDPNERTRSLAYGVFTAAALRALHDVVRRARAGLPRVRVPTFVIQSREDNRISVDAAERAFAMLGAADKRLEWISGAAHVITVDYGRDHVIAQLAAFMDAHAPPRALDARGATSGS